MLDPYRSASGDLAACRQPSPPAGTTHGQGAVLPVAGEGYPGTYTRVTAFIRQWKAAGGASGRPAFVPLHFPPGEAFQFDWSREYAFVGGHAKMRAGGRPREAGLQPGVLAGGLSHPEPRDAVRCPYPGVRRLRRRAPPRHLRQHEDGGGQGRPHRERPSTPASRP
jgi:hypothetical protein